MDGEGQSADEIVSSFPQLTLADVYAALTFYHDHQAEVDADIRQDEEVVAQFRALKEGGPVSGTE